jgi:hypothetical protein
MPGDPHECRKHAANCKRRAEQATIQEVRERYLCLAAQWERLALELESLQPLLSVLTEDSIPPPLAKAS